MKRATQKKLLTCEVVVIEGGPYPVAAGELADGLVF